MQLNICGVGASLPHKYNGRMPLRLIGIALACAWVSLAQPDAKSQLDKAIRDKIAGFRGDVSLYAKNLETGQTYGIRENDPVRTASTIKLPIMIECFFEAGEGKLDWKQPITITEDEKVSGSGIAQELSNGDVLPIRDLVDLMIVLSDNTATNLILNRVPADAVNTRMAQLGLQQTRCMRKILGDGNKLKSEPSGISAEGAKPENRKWGIGRSSPREMVVLLEKLYRGELVNRQASDEMLEILKRQRDHDCIGRDMKDITIASKSGALDHLRSDLGILYTAHGAIAMAFTVDNFPDVNWTPDNPAALLISSLSEIIAQNLAAPH